MVMFVKDLESSICRMPVSTTSEFGKHEPVTLDDSMCALGIF
jgi:hypothetical protein